MPQRIIGIEWDAGNWPKCGKHGVSKDEIEALLRGDPMILPDRVGQLAEVRFNAVGRVGDRYVFLVFTVRERPADHYFRPISARYMHAKEVKHYEG